MTPFTHWIIDGMFNENTLRKVIAEWPDASAMAFKACGTSVKAHCSEWGSFGLSTKAFLEYLNSPSFIGHVEKLTGMDGLLADSELNGGGLHEIPPGGYLKMHADFNWHPRLQAVRKLNLLLYLNEGWEWNGELILSSDGNERSKVIEPLFNRCVIFPTTSTSWHGHPEPLEAPRSRRSIALYYYRKEPKPAVVHSTIYVKEEACAA